MNSYITWPKISAVLFWFILSEVLVITSAFVGAFVLGNQQEATVLSQLMHKGNGDEYLRIATREYQYEVGRPSLVAFFPGYPMAIRCLMWTFRMPSEIAAGIIANACLFGAMFLFSTYSAYREVPTARWQSLAAFALFPTTFFFRMAYSESLFLILCIAMLLAISKKMSPWIVAGIVGALTGIRPVGVAALIPLALYGWESFGVGRARAPKMLGLMILGSWGIDSYMGYQYATFGDALAFAKTQAYYRVRPDYGIADELIAYAASEPIWSVFLQQSPAYRAAVFGNESTNWVFNLQFANPLIFLTIILCLIFGAQKGLLTRYEIALSIGLLAIPYVTRAYELYMANHGRFAAICFPAYFVIGAMLRRAGMPATTIVLSAFAFYLAAYSLLFGAGHRLN